MRQHIRYRGRVQGVGFRATARAVAQGHAVTGWVRNDADGSVVLEVQGDDGAVQAFHAELDALLGRLVASRDVSLVEPRPEETTFEVRR